MEKSAVPEAGQAVLVRSRPGIVTDVNVHQTNGAASHLVEVEYFDEWDFPPTDRVIWEREVGASILHETGLPRLDGSLQPDPPKRMAAFLDALRWTSTARLPGLVRDQEAGQAIFSPWESAVAVEPYQLYPVLKATEMPRVTLLLADDVGLGKTIEAGLVLRELIARRRIRRALVICPASLQAQWREELTTKFSLDFTVVDRAAVVDTQREYGTDVNPWSVIPRAITSMDYLRQPDVLSRFEAAATTLQRGHALPWDLLIVDECHNLAPRTALARSQRTEMLARVAPFADHRLFLSATPHSGFTASFSGLLELLDPVRFRQTSSFTKAERDQIDVVMVRRLKSELNQRAVEHHESTPFTDRHVERVNFAWTKSEQRLVDALYGYRKAAHDVLGRLPRRERTVGQFIFSLLIKRLLSSTYAFATTWWRHIDGFGHERTVADAETAVNRAEAETSDDEEKALREEDLVREGAGWLREHAAELADARDVVSEALSQLGWSRERVDEGLETGTELPPDGKWDAFAAEAKSWLEQHLKENGEFRDDERAIVFTEYKDTLDYLLRRLSDAGIELPRTRSLFGGAGESERVDVKQAFNDAADPIRLLVATDVAAEGLNLQATSRYVLHWEIPWNPMRMEQRNGRVDRHGQARDVTAFHFFSGEDADLAFLNRVADKVAQVREDLGSVGEVIDLSIRERFETGELTIEELDERIETTLESSGLSRDVPEPSAPADERAGLDALEAAAVARDEMGFSPAAAANLLSESVTLEGGGLEGGEDGTWRLTQPVPSGWQATVNRHLRIEHGPAQGAVPRLTFDPEHLMTAIGDRHVFRERADLRLIRLSHPLMRKATSGLRKRLWQPGGELTRFTIVSATDLSEAQLHVPCLISLTNELREPLHSEVLELGAPLADPGALEHSDFAYDPIRLEDPELREQMAAIGEHADEITVTLTEGLAAVEERLRERAEDLLPELLETELAAERERYRTRLSELAGSDKRREAGLKRLRDELIKAEVDAAQLTFDADVRRTHEERVRALREEVEAKELRLVQERRARLRRRLEAERDRLLNEVLPRRYAIGRLTLTPAAVIAVIPTQEDH